MIIIIDKSIRNTIIRTAFPAMAEMMLYMLIGVVDIAVVGRLGAAPLAAVSLGAEIFFAVVLLLESLGIGASILVAQAQGAGQLDNANKIAGQTFILALLVGTMFGTLGLLYDRQLVNIFQVEPLVYDQVLGYLNIVFWITPLALGYYMINTLYRGLGRTEIPMFIAILVNIINCFGNYTLVYGKFGLPPMGVAGAAVATSIAHVIGFLIACYILFSGRAGLKAGFLDITRIRLFWQKQILKLGLPSLGEQLFFTISNLVSTFLIVSLGTASFASHQVALTVESLSFMPGYGVAIAATSLVGRSIGAKNKETLSRVSRGSIEVALIIMGMLGVLFAALPQVIASLFTRDMVIIQTAGILIRIASLEQLTMALSMVLSGILKGAGDTRSPMFISTFATWVYRLPLMYLFIRILHLPIQYIWLLFVSDWALRTIAYLIIYNRRKWYRNALT
ncbi:MAG TPA: MATE family efflux transporter [Syntrophomonadaceae bacterium]|nr:MATE family efflux transporter [Syntrophomonadaceae bacterium]